MMWQTRLFWQVFGSISLLAAGGSCLFATVVNGWLARQELIHAKKGMKAVAVAAAKAVQDRPSNALEVLKEVATSSDFRVVGFDGDGKALTKEGRSEPSSGIEILLPEISAALNVGTGDQTRFDPATGEERVFLASRVDADASAVRVVQVSASQRELLATVRSLQIGVWLGAVTLVGALALAAFWLAWKVVPPIKALAVGMNELAEGELGYRVYASATADYALLCRSFNQMAQAMEARFEAQQADLEQMRTVLGSMAEGVIAIDEEQRVLFANHRAAVLLDLPSRPVVGRRLWEVARQRPLLDAVRAAVETGSVQVHDMQWSFPANRTMSAHLAKLPGDGSRGLVIVLHDTTELRRLERLRQEFFANVSHELKTPLAVIQACVETLMLGAGDDPADRNHFLGTIDEQSQRLHVLIMDMLQLARIESATEAVSLQPIAVVDSAVQCVGRHLTLAESKNQTVSVVLTDIPQDSVVLADDEALDRILDNLVGNALRYTPEGGTIRVRFGFEDRWVRIDVQDTGIGISESDLARVFERFFRVDKARSRELGGTGLGLSIVKHLAQLMGGSVRAASQEGIGSVFSVLLSAVPSERDRPKK